MSEYISRDDALQCACELLIINGGCTRCSEEKKVCNSVREAFAIIPAADVEEKRTGKWIKTSYVERSAFGRAIWHKTFQCSRCGSLFGREGDKYCYNCGADMSGEDDG